MQAGFQLFKTRTRVLRPATKSPVIPYFNRSVGCGVSLKHAAPRPLQRTFAGPFEVFYVFIRDDQESLHLDQLVILSLKPERYISICDRNPDTRVSTIHDHVLFHIVVDTN